MKTELMVVIRSTGSCNPWPGPRDAEIFVAAMRGAVSGHSDYFPVYKMPPEVQAMDGDAFLACDWAKGLVEEAKADLKVKIEELLLGDEDALLGMVS